MPDITSLTPNRLVRDLARFFASGPFLMSASSYQINSEWRESRVAAARP
jgi:hypothetical protein